MISEQRKQHLESVAVGNIVAFKNGENLYSGKVIEVAGKFVTIQTKNGSIFYVDKYESIVWVKNGSRYPVGIFNALKRNSNKEK